MFQRYFWKRNWTKKHLQPKCYPIEENWGENKENIKTKKSEHLKKIRWVSLSSEGFCALTYMYIDAIVQILRPPWRADAKMQMLTLLCDSNHKKAMLWLTLHLRCHDSDFNLFIPPSLTWDEFHCVWSCVPPDPPVTGQNSCQLILHVDNPRPPH